MRLRAGLLVAPLALMASMAVAADCDPAHVTVLTGSGPVGYVVEIADDPRERATGLMFRTEMPRDVGMLFIFDDPSPRSFWMKNTVLPLDIVFIDRAGRVLNIAERTTPFSEAPIPSDGDALAVLEVNAGEAARRGISPGDQVLHPAFVEAPAEHRCGD